MTAQFAESFGLLENDLDDDDGSIHLSIEHHDDFVCICFVLLVVFFFLPGNESETSVIIVWATAAYE